MTVKKAFRGEFNGKLYINESLESLGKVSVFITDTTLHLGRGGDRPGNRDISFDPFNRQLLLAHKGPSLRESFFYEISGTQVGRVSQGPLGHPGDGEYHYWPMRRFRVEVSFHAGGIIAAISGETGAGLDGFDEHKALAPQYVKASFEIPIDEVKDFFQLTDSGSEHTTKRFRDAFGSP
jgi:hypothetical protein